jgi:hypothetical protein
VRVATLPGVSRDDIRGVKRVFGAAGRVLVTTLINDRVKCEGDYVTCNTSG